MDNTKASNSIAAGLISLLAAATAWLQANAAILATLVAIIAGVYSIYAAHTSAKLNKRRIAVLDEKLKLMAKMQNMSELAVREAMKED